MVTMRIAKNVPVIWKAKVDIPTDNNDVITLNFDLSAFMIESLRKAAEQHQSIEIWFQYEREG